MLRALLKAMRPKQWAKNILIFAGIVFDGQLLVLNSVWRVGLGTALFCLLASSVYLINDISDVEEDRKHPTKRNRPIAAGDLSVNTARIAVVVFLIAVFPTAFWLSPAFAILCGLYFIFNLAYSAWIKHIVILDVLLLASFYVLRVGVGVTLIQVQRFSPWLYLATIFLALFMGIGKRRAELISAQTTGNNHRKVLSQYTVPFLDQLSSIVLTITIVTYSLYTFSAPNLPENHIMMATNLFVLYGVFRYLYLVQVEGHGETPEDLVLSDKPFIINMVLWGASVLLIFYYF